MRLGNLCGNSTIDRSKLFSILFQILRKYQIRHVVRLFMLYFSLSVVPTSTPFPSLPPVPRTSHRSPSRDLFGVRRPYRSETRISVDTRPYTNKSVSDLRVPFDNRPLCRRLKTRYGWEILKLYPDK